MKHHLNRAALFSVACLVSVGLMELMVRVFLPRYDPSGTLAFYRGPQGVPLGQKNSTLRMWKNTHDFDVSVTFNAYGLRDDKDLRHSTMDDIFVVGDSFSMGFGVDADKRYSNLLEDHMHRPVYNIAMVGGIDDYDKLVRYAQRNGATIGNLIVGVCMENDLLYYGPNAGAFKPNTPPLGPLQKTKVYLEYHSAAYGAATEMFHGSARLESLGVKLGLIIPNLEGIERNRFSEPVLSSSTTMLARLVAPFRATILIIPSRALWVSDNRTTERRVHDRFIELLKEKNLDVVDMRPYFEMGDQPLQYHFKTDGHWNEKGHAKAAEILGEHLKQRLALR